MIKAEKDPKEKKSMQARYKIFKGNVYTTFKKEINDEEAVQSISEVYNSKPPYLPGGTCSQAWSVSEVLKIIIKS